MKRPRNGSYVLRTVLVSFCFEAERRPRDARPTTASVAPPGREYYSSAHKMEEI